MDKLVAKSSRSKELANAIDQAQNEVQFGLAVSEISYQELKVAEIVFEEAKRVLELKKQKHVAAFDKEEKSKAREKTARDDLAPCTASTKLLQIYLSKENMSGDELKAKATAKAESSQHEEVA